MRDSSSTTGVLEWLSREVPHYECEDCWYSCATICCDEHRHSDKCDCGADQDNEMRRAALSLLSETTLNAAPQATATPKGVASTRGTVADKPVVAAPDGQFDKRETAPQLEHMISAMQCYAPNPCGDGHLCIHHQIAQYARSARGNKLPSLPHDIQEWCWHMDLHLTEHDERHAAMALRSAWPHVSKWLQENVAPSQGGTPYVNDRGSDA